MTKPLGAASTRCIKGLWKPLHLTNDPLVSLPEKINVQEVHIHRLPHVGIMSFNYDK